MVCHAETSVACLVQCPGGSPTVVTVQAYMDSGFAVCARASFLAAFNQENGSSPDATRDLKPVSERSSWQLVFYRNEQAMPGGALPAVAQRGGGLSLGCVVCGRSEALYLGALALGRCWIITLVIPA